ncbi:MAG: pilus assembly protein [Alcaligenaceae bacterium]|nr:pilus assembly protein [Alcaligenaceae bacterium]
MNTNRRTAARRRHLQRGVAALEAALLMPVAIFLLLGSFETYQYFRADAIVARASFAVANGVAMQPKLIGGSCKQSDSVCTYSTIAQDLFTPLNYEAHGGLIISGFKTDVGSGSNPKAEWDDDPWSCSYKGSKGAAGPESRIADTEDFPPPRAGDTLIVAEVFYEYEPYIMSSKFWSSLGGTKMLYSRFFFRPRFEELGAKPPCH